MGRRKGRKRRSRRDRESLGAEALRRSEARRKRRRSDDDFFGNGATASPTDDDMRALTWQPGPRSLMAAVREDLNPGATALTCENCHEFVPGDTGRGRCLHPGSGVLGPWPDTEACQFHEVRRRR
ncbi:MAG: hypothetical protein F4Y97_09685 [Dehalococcoidia bacterium]|nr:hypothetical protein [Dehalococcoidia bacterium]